MVVVVMMMVMMVRGGEDGGVENKILDDRTWIETTVCLRRQ